MLGRVVIPSNKSFESSFEAINLNPPHVVRAKENVIAKIVRYFLAHPQEVTVSLDNKTLAMHPTRPLVAILQANVISILAIRCQDGLLSAGAPLNISRQRLNHPATCLAWAHESQNTLLVGTASNLYSINVPQPDAVQQFNASEVEIKPIPLPHKGPVERIATFPMGRLFACVSTAKSRSVAYVGDAWMKSVEALIEQKNGMQDIHWMEEINTVVIISKDNNLTIVDGNTWRSEQYDLGTSPFSLIRHVPSSAAVLLVERELNTIAWIDLVLTIDSNSVLLKQSPAKKTTLTTEHINGRVRVKDLQVNSKGSLLACTYEDSEEGSDGKILPLVTVYTAYHVEGSMSISYLRTISREEEEKYPESFAISRIANLDVVFVLWSDNILTYQAL